MNMVLSGSVYDDEDDLEDKINTIIEGRKMVKNASYFAFTATPKNKTLEMFGKKERLPDGTTKPEPHYVYTMKQAIEEGFIMDVLRHFTPVQSYYKLAKTIEDDPKFDKKRAQRLLRYYVESNQYAIHEKANIVSEEQVKKALQIDSFRNLSKDKIVEFASLIPHMDKDVAIAIINQFPAYVESSRNMIEQYNAMCDKVLQSNDDSRKDAVMAYKTILDDLSILLKQDGITPEQQEKITDKMILVADKIADLHEDNRNFLEGIIKYGTPLIGGALLLGAVILGVNVKGTKLPTINGKK